MDWLIVLAYVYSIVDKLSTVVGHMIFVSVILMLLGGAVKFCAMLEYSEKTTETAAKASKLWEDVSKRLLRLGTVPFFLFCAIYALLPSQEGMKYIAGAAIVSYSADAVSSINGIEQMPEKVVTLVNTLIDDIVEDVQEKEAEEDEPAS